MTEVICYYVHVNIDNNSYSLHMKEENKGQIIIINI